MITFDLSSIIGYPIEDPEGWSSPAFVVKSVKKKGVPYKVRM